MIAFAFAVALLLSDDSAVTAPASPQADTPAPAAAPAAKDPKDKVICRKEHVPGSNRPQKICMTARQWTDGDAETGKSSKH